MVAAIAAGVGAGGSIIGGAISSSASGAAAKAQETASSEALASQNAEEAYQNQQQLGYIANGDNAQTVQNQLIGQYGSMVTPYLNQLTQLGQGATAQSALEQTPGYQFTLAQGLKSTQNAAAARGLGVSGAALKGAASYSTGLADNTYQQQYNDASNNLTQAQNTFAGLNSPLAAEATLGGNVSVAQGTQAQGYATAANSLITGSGNAAAAGTIGSANATQSGLNGITTAANGYAQNQLLQNYLGSNGSQYGSNNASTLDNAVSG